MAKAKSTKNEKNDVKDKTIVKEKKDNIKILKEELNEYIDSKLEEKIDLNKINNDLKEYVNILVKKDLSIEVEKANKKLIREKNRRLFYRDVIIILLIVIIVFLLRLMYKSHYFDKFFTDEPQTVVVEKEKVVEIDEPIVNHIQTFEELVDEYGDLINNYYISENCKYISDFYDGKLSNELKMYMTLNNMKFDTLTLEDEYNIIEADEFEKAYEKLFDDEISKMSFDYNGNKLRYITKLDSFMSDEVLTKTKSKINREIVNIEVEDDIIKITTVEGILKDDKLYNVVTEKLVKNYTEGDISKYEEELNTVTYVFNKKVLEDLEV